MPQSSSQARKTDSLIESLRCEYVTSPIDTLLTRDDVIALINFDGRCELASDPRVVNTGCLALNSDTPIELWTSSEPLDRGQQGPLSWSKNDGLIFLSYWVEGSDEVPLMEAVRQAYAEILEHLHNADYPNIQRMWNYISNINSGAADDERYKLFCSGRHQAFQQSGMAEQAFPAACAIGQHSPHSIIYLLATRQPGRHFENPRQISAYRYPRQYGPNSPSFARATQYSNDPNLLFLSGTASVLGHSTQHSEDPMAQLQETLLNIDALMTHAGKQTSSPPPKPQLLKIYLRDASLLDDVRECIHQRWEDVAVLYLEGDICRVDLALEIDGIFHFGGT